MRLVFCGTPAFAVPSLQGLRSAGHSIELVLCQPDRPSGRGLTLTVPPVKQAALEAGLEVLQPEKIRNNTELRSRLETIRPDAIIVVAYGRLIPGWMLNLPRFGNLNLHGSLLPKYRGAAPIQWAVANGETVTGVTTMRLDEGMDTGDMLLRRELPIGPADTAEELFPRLAEVGAPLMVETLAGLEAGTIAPQKQDSSLATLAPLLTREDGRVDTTRTVQSIYDRWRGFQPWPGAWTTVRGKKLTLHQLVVSPSAPQRGEPGVFRVEADRLFFAAGDGRVLEVTELQAEGKRRMPAADLLRGHGVVDGDRLGS
ncbi:MAG TPA: methionyl-tRNA formyltransferase [Acidobacteriaceae bacterium]|jgi:methionyl-tRNA formyltransferase|nr:methionyl-tRNA formyltransferase [Acidobacteriaceae bacterium]